LLRVRDFNPVQPVNAPDSIVVTELGISSDDKYVQPLKAQDKIVVSEVGNETEDLVLGHTINSVKYFEKIIPSKDLKCELEGLKEIVLSASHPEKVPEDKVESDSPK